MTDSSYLVTHQPFWAPWESRDDDSRLLLSHVTCSYPDGRFVVAATTSSNVSRALTFAALELHLAQNPL